MLRAWAGRAGAPTPGALPLEEGFVKAERLSAVDTAWLRMDGDVNLMVIVGVWLLRPALSLEALRGRVAERLLCHRRFRQRVVIDWLGACWVDDPHFDLKRHVVRAPLRSGAGVRSQRALLALCGELAAAPLDPRHPLWQFHFVEHYGRGSALVVRLHHCIADGVSLLPVLRALTDEGSTQPGVPGEEVPTAPPEPRAPWGWAAPWAARWPGQPAHSPGPDGLELPRSGLRLAQDLAEILLMPQDSTTRLKGPMSGRKAVAWSQPLALADLRAVGGALNCSVNDVLLACAATALARWLREQGDNPQGLEIRVLVPVNLRPAGVPQALGNCFGLAPLLLPLGLDNPLEQAWEVRRRMRALKEGFQPLLALGVLALAGSLPRPAQEALLQIYSSRTTAAITNLAGPDQTLHVCGTRLEQAVFWVPASGEIGVGLSILSYRGAVQCGLMTDRARCEHPQTIVDKLPAAFETLLLASLMLPWPTARSRA